MAIPCYACGGDGFVKGSRAAQCQECGGSGYRPLTDRAALAAILLEWGLEVRKIGAESAGAGTDAVELLAWAIDEMEA